VSVSFKIEIVFLFWQPTLTNHFHHRLGRLFHTIHCLRSLGQHHQQNGNSPAAKQFDIVAVTPLTEKLFAQCCEKLDVDVITLDLAHRLPYFIKPKQANVAIERGVYFEIGYSA